MKKLEAYPYIKQINIGEVQVTLEVTDEKLSELKKMSKSEFKDYIQSNATVRVTDFDVDYIIDSIDDFEIENIISQPPCFNSK